MTVEVYIDREVVNGDTLVETLGDYIRQIGQHTVAAMVETTITRPDGQLIGTAEYKNGSYSYDVY